MGRGIFCMFSRASARSLHVCALMVVVTFVVCSVVLVDVGGVVFFCRFGRCTWWGDKGQIGSLLALFLSHVGSGRQVSPSQTSLVLLCFLFC